MDFFKKKSKATSDVKSVDNNTPVQSGAPSELEKEIRKEPSVHSTTSRSESQPATTQVAETTLPPEEQNAVEKKSDNADGAEDEDDIEYPKAMKLTLITIALCLSVFCMAVSLASNSIIS